MGKLRKQVWAALLIGGAGLSWVYFRHWMPVERNGMDKDLFNRRIGTPVLEWMNGFLGPFFNLDYLGALNWLAIPVIIWWAFKPPGRKAWHRGLALLAASGALLIGAFGGFNPRYAFTLHPLLLAMVFIGAWTLLERSGASLLQRRQWLVALVALQFFNTALNVEYRIKVWRTEKAERAMATGNKTGEVGPAKEMSVQEWLAARHVADTARVLVNNLPEFWYGGQRKGLYYWSGSDQLYEANGPSLLFGPRTDGQVCRHLLVDLDCRWVLTTRDLSEYGERFQPFLESHCTLVAEGPRHLRLYAVRQNCMSP